jgi:hypothetical protein
MVPAWNISVCIHGNEWLFLPNANKVVVNMGFRRGTRWRSWLRHCTTSLMVAGSIPNGVTGIFHGHNPSSRTMALGLTQPLTEYFLGGKGSHVHRADNLTTFICRLSWNMGASTSWNPQDLSRPVMGLLYGVLGKSLWKWKLYLVAVIEVKWPQSLWTSVFDILNFYDQQV